jgi:hypothetical protein
VRALASALAQVAFEGEVPESYAVKTAMRAAAAPDPTTHPPRRCFLRPVGHRRMPIGRWPVHWLPHRLPSNTGSSRRRLRRERAVMLRNVSAARRRRPVPDPGELQVGGTGDSWLRRAEKVEIIWEPAPGCRSRGHLARQRLGWRRASFSRRVGAARCLAVVLGRLHRLRAAEYGSRIGDRPMLRRTGQGGPARTCPTGYHCAGTVCLPDGEESDTRKTGACSTDSDCSSGHCFAGLCQK